ncbi:MAG: AAA family ATPase [Candidatus Lokiarchaeota archaeon]|nr:AAA family ATPase [Candidatus Lokiarchaeota archaeon]
MQIISVSGGKGGTGKTFVAVNLALYLATKKKNVLLMDCDVENPNTNILLGKTDLSEFESAEISHFVPKFDENKCTKCGKCAQVCRPHAIFQIINQIPLLMQNLCTSCELCYRVCPDDAIIPSYEPLGKIYLKTIRVQDTSLDLMVGELSVGQVQAVKILERMYKKLEKLNATHKYDYIITDSAPGAHCDVEFVIKQSKYVLCVTEPTPFGIHDLKRILELSNIVQRNTFVIMNRATITDYPLNNLEKDHNTHIIASIPYDLQIMESYAQGIPFLFYKLAEEKSSSKIAIESIGQFVVQKEKSTYD